MENHLSFGDHGHDPKKKKKRLLPNHPKFLSSSMYKRTDGGILGWACDQPNSEEWTAVSECYHQQTAGHSAAHEWVRGSGTESENPQTSRLYC